ncbi:MAG TPA: cellulase family glycosylhydrolase [Actinoplanes sp.]
MERFVHRSRVVAALAGAVAVITAVPLALAITAPPAAAATSQFRGLNWARMGDNFYGGPLVLHGLTETDSYSTVLAKADAVYAGFQNNLGANTVRLPINTYSVGTAWWDSYTGAIDAATARGMTVILSAWDDGRGTNGGRVADTSAFNAMWDTVVAKYGANSLVDFELLNEPHGYGADEWKTVVAAWISARPSVPRNRIFVSGSGYNQDIQTMCADSRFDGTYLSLHHYTFFSGAKTHDEWVTYLKNAIGTCASRTVLDEFGAPMDTGLNYNDAASTDNFVAYFHAATQVLRELQMGSVYWPGLGGKITAGQTDDWYSMQKLQGSGTNLTLTTPSASGAGRLRYAWGLE